MEYPLKGKWARKPHRCLHIPRPPSLQCCFLLLKRCHWLSCVKEIEISFVELILCKLTSVNPGRVIFAGVVWAPPVIWGCLEITVKAFEPILKRRDYIKYQQLLQWQKVEFSLQELLSFGAQANYQQESGIVPPGTISWMIWEGTGISIPKCSKSFQSWGKQFVT